MNTETQLLKDKSVAIVGGGPGDLTLARLLQMNGVNVNVYERDGSRNVRVQGATLDLHMDSGLKALREAGLMDAFKANYRPGADKMLIVNKNAEILYADEFSGEGEAFRPEIDRGPLRDILIDSLKLGTVIWDSQFLLLDQQNGCIKLDFKNGTSAFADLVIAADGANSRIRPYITSVKPYFVGVTVIEGSVNNAVKVIPEINGLLNGGKIIVVDDSKSLILSAKGDGTVNFYAGFNTNENWLKESGINFKDNVQVIYWLKNYFAGWSDMWNDMFENASQFIPRPQYCMPLDQHWEPLPNLTMLGDAAHLMPPYAGEGVNMAMLDALELAECLLSNEYIDIKDAIEAYEKRMLERVSVVAQITLEQTALFHSDKAAEKLVAMFNQF